MDFNLENADNQSISRNRSQTQMILLKFRPLFDRPWIRVSCCSLLEKIDDKMYLLLTTKSIAGTSFVSTQVSYYVRQFMRQTSNCESRCACTWSQIGHRETSENATINESTSSFDYFCNLNFYAAVRGVFVGVGDFDSSALLFSSAAYHRLVSKLRGGNPIFSPFLFITYYLGISKFTVASTGLENGNCELEEVIVWSSLKYSLKNEFLSFRFLMHLNVSHSQWD